MLRNKPISGIAQSHERDETPKSLRPLGGTNVISVTSPECVETPQVRSSGVSGAARHFCGNGVRPDVFQQELFFWCLLGRKALKKAVKGVLGSTKS
nr:hypothetical protein Iba_chr04aCG9630 [Ipomoea batatas]